MSQSKTSAYQPLLSRLSSLGVGLRLCTFLLATFFLNSPAISSAFQQFQSPQATDLFGKSPFTRETFIRAQPDPSGDLWTLSELGEVRRYDGFAWHPYPVFPDRAPRVHDLRVMPDGTPWISTSMGVLYFDGEQFQEVAMPLSLRGQEMVSIHVFADGQISLIGRREGGMPFATTFKGDTWSLADLPDLEEDPIFYQLSDTVEYLGTPKRLYIRRQGQDWEESIRPFSSNRLAFETSASGDLAVFHTSPGENLTITLYDSRGEPRVTTGHSIPLNAESLFSTGATTRDSGGNMLFTAYTGGRQALYRLDENGPVALIEQLPYPRSQIRDLSANADQAIWIAGEGLLAHVDLSLPKITFNEGASAWPLEPPEQQDFELIIDFEVFDSKNLDSGYLWVLGVDTDFQAKIGRWDEVLSEWKWVTLSEDPIPVDPDQWQIFTVENGDLIIRTGPKLFSLNQDLRDPAQALLSPREEILDISNYDGGKRIAIVTSESPSRQNLLSIESGNVRRQAINIDQWVVLNLSDPGTLYLRKHDRSAIGRLRLGRDSGVSAIQLGELKVTDRPVHEDGSKFYFEVYQPFSNSWVQAVYTPSDAPPRARARAFTQLNDQNRYASALKFEIPSYLNRSQQPETLHASYRIDRGSWSSFKPINTDGTLQLPNLPIGDHELDVRLRNQDFVISKDFQRIKVTIPSTTSRPDTPYQALLWVAIVSALLALILTARRLVKSHNYSNFLNQEIQARQQAQSDLMDINQDLEKQLKRRKQELIFANEGLKKQVDERRHTEAQLKHAQAALVESSRQAGMAEIATGILQNIGNMLNSLNLSLNTIEKRLGTNKANQNLERLAKLIEENRGQPTFLSEDPKGQKVPEFLHKLAHNIAEENRQNSHYIQDMAVNIDHLKDIVSAQQNYAKVAGVVERLDLEETIRQTLKLSEHSINRQNLVVEVHVEDCPPIQSERPKLQQILLNLLQNAQWACAENAQSIGRIVVTAFAAEDAHVAIEVKDNGLGIDAENLNKVFYHGFTTQEDAKGLGLHTAETLTKQLHGTIEAFSEGNLQGATFRITLPVLPPKKPQATSQWPHTNTPPIRGSA